MNDTCRQSELCEAMQPRNVHLSVGQSCRFALICYRAAMSTGRNFAALVPAVKWALRQQRPTVGTGRGRLVRMKPVRAELVDKLSALVTDAVERVLTGVGTIFTSSHFETRPSLYATSTIHY